MDEIKGNLLLCFFLSKIYVKNSRNSKGNKIAYNKVFESSLLNFDSFLVVKAQSVKLKLFNVVSKKVNQIGE